MQYSRPTVALAIDVACSGVAACDSDTTENPPGATPPPNAGLTEAAADSNIADDANVDDANVDDATADAGAVEDAADEVPDAAGLPPFSFFYTSLAAMRRLSGSANGFGG